MLPSDIYFTLYGFNATAIAARLDANDIPSRFQDAVIPVGLDATAAAAAAFAAAVSFPNLEEFIQYSSINVLPRRGLPVNVANLCSNHRHSIMEYRSS